MYIDLLVQIKNAQQAKKEKVKVPYTKMDMAVLEVLSKYKYIGEVSKKGRPAKRNVEIKLVYDHNRGAISGVKLVSKPSRRIYLGYKDLKSVKQGYGLAVLSTPKGIMSGSEAKKAKVGGQLLFEIW